MLSNPAGAGAGAEPAGGGDGARQVALPGSLARAAACGAGTFGSGGKCSKCPTGRTTPAVWNAAQLKAGASYGPWKAPIAGYVCQTDSSSYTKEADVIACKKSCSAAVCAGVMWEAHLSDTETTNTFRA